MTMHKKLKKSITKRNKAQLHQSFDLQAAKKVYNMENQKKLNKRQSLKDGLNEQNLNLKYLVDLKVNGMIKGRNQMYEGINRGGTSDIQKIDGQFFDSQIVNLRLSQNQKKQNQVNFYKELSMAQNSITYTDSYTKESATQEKRFKLEGMQSNKDLTDYHANEGLKSVETLLKSPKKNKSRTQLDNSPIAIRPTGIVAVPRLNIQKLKKYVDTKSVEDHPRTKESGKFSKSQIKPAEVPMRKKYQRHE